MKAQIEETRKDLIEIFDEEYEKRRMITPDFTAEKMTAKGYRKQKEGEWIETPKRICAIKCGACGDEIDLDTGEDYLYWKYCPLCGAKMKGD